MVASCLVHQFVELLKRQTDGIAQYYQREHSSGTRAIGRNRRKKLLAVRNLQVGLSARLICS